MTNAELGAAAGKNANDSRRAGVHRRRSWTRPFRRTRRAIECSLRLLDSSSRLFEATEQVAGQRPVRAARQFERVSAWVSEAAAQLACAARGLQKTLDCAAQSLDVALDAPAKLAEATEAWIQAAGQLAAFSARMDGVSGRLLESVKSGAIPIPLEEQGANAGKPVTTFRLIPPPLRPPNWLPYERNVAPCIPPRRQRSILLTLAEAARRIFRGRAPPLVSTCSL